MVSRWRRRLGRVRREGWIVQQWYGRRRDKACCAGEVVASRRGGRGRGCGRGCEQLSPVVVMILGLGIVVAVVMVATVVVLVVVAI